MKPCRRFLLAGLILVSVDASGAEKKKEGLYAQLNRAIIRLEHVERVQQEKAATTIVRNVGDGTAFFVRSRNELYVVSARHVVEQQYDLHARVECRNEKTSKEEVILLELPRTGWAYHKEHGDANTRFVDVAAMKIPWIKDRSIKAFRYEPKESEDRDKNQLPFEDPEPPQAVLVFGFPAGHHFDENREGIPETRRGEVCRGTMLSYRCAHVLRQQW